MPRAKKSLTEKEDLYTITLVVGDKTYVQKNVDATEAILSLKPESIKCRCVFTMKYKGKTSQLMKNGTLSKLLLNNHARAFYLAKALTLLLK
jgi:hypothetical protein